MIIYVENPTQSTKETPKTNKCIQSSHWIQDEFKKSISK